jgi:hypothetical protein
MMATQENTTTGSEGLEERRRYMMRDADQRCWREATQHLSRWAAEPEVCREHFERFHKARKMDAMLDTIMEMGEWIAGATSGGVEEPLWEYAFKMIEAAYADYWRAAVEHYAANLIAIQGRDEEPLTQEQAKRLAGPMLGSQELDKVSDILEFVPQEALGAKSRWPLLAALYAEGTAISEDLDRARREIRTS